VTELSTALDQLSPERRRALALLLRQRGLDPHRELPIPRRAESGPVPLSFAQERLWFLWRLEPEGLEYNLPGGVRLLGELSRDALGAALAELVARHESLRTRFVADQGVPRQHIDPPSAVPLRFEDLSGDPPPVARVRADELSDAEAQTPFDLERGPLLRVTLLRLAAREHLLLLDVHHVIADAWTLRLLAEELVTLYAHALGGGRGALPRPLQYADFAVWQREWLAAGEADRQLEYWKRTLGSAAASSPLPGRRRRSSRATGGHLDVPFERELAAALAALARAQGVTLFALLGALFHVCLYRHSGVSPLRVGVPVAGRQRSELEGCMGLFTNTLVLQSHPSQRQSFAEFLGSFERAALEAHEYQDLPFDRLVNALEPRRSLDRTPLFQVMHNHLKHTTEDATRVAGLAIVPFGRRVPAAQFDLSLTTTEDGGTPRSLTFVYATDRLYPETVARLAERYLRLARDAALHPERALGDLELLGSEEHAQLAEWNATDAPFPEGCTLQELWAQAVQSHPRATAVVFGTESITYADLAQRAERLAAALRTQGVGPDVVVGLAVERSIEMMVGVLGILMAGGAYLPLEPEWPAERVAGMLRDVSAPLVLTLRRCRDCLRDADVAVHLLDGEEPEREAPEREAPVLQLDRGTHPRNLAYCIFTSGSTGTPKGAGNSHEALVNRLSWMQTRFAIGPGDRVLQKTPLGFDVSVWELFWPLLAGATLVVAPPGAHREPRALERVIREHAVTTVHFVPAMLQAFVDGADLTACRSLRHILCSGEALPAELARSVLAAHPAALHNLYGPTEAAIDVTEWQCRLEDIELSVPIGRPIQNLRMHVLDGHLGRLPSGVTGELFIAGVGLARGYLGRPALTAERFLPNPVGRAPGERMYRTGDLARYSDDGAIEYEGRIDHQVKIRGLRIELGEIEARLASHPGVRACAVVMRGSAVGKQLVAYAVCAQDDLDPPEVDRDERARADQLTDFLRRSLPNYMVPSLWTFLDALPLSPNGKVDRRALPEPRGVTRQHVPPRSVLEERVARVWCDVLRVERAGANDDFFELGGNSLLATQVVARLSDVLGAELPLRLLFEHPDLEGLARALEPLLRQRPAQVRPPIRPQPRGEAFPLSAAQSRLWFLWELDRQSPAYNVGTALRLRGELSMPALQQTFDRLVTRHESFRTTFSKSEDGEPVQRIAPTRSQWIALEEAPATDPGERERWARERVQGAVQEPFDLERGPLSRVLLLRLGPSEHVLAVSMHHIISDGWSLGVIVEEFTTAYVSHVQGREPAFAELPLQYADYAVWQRAWLDAGERERQLAYWRERLGSGVPLLHLPADRPPPLGPSFAGAEHRFVLETARARGVAACAERASVTAFCVLLGAFSLVASERSGQTHFSLGTDAANRSQPEIAGLVGFFINQLVLDVRVDPALAVSSWLQRLQTGVLGALQHEDLPFDQVVEALAPARRQGRAPFFTTKVIYQERPHTPAALPGLELEPWEVQARGAELDLVASFVNTRSRIDVSFNYAREHFELESIRELEATLLAVLDALGDHLETPVAGVLALARQTRQQLKERRAAERSQAIKGFGAIEPRARRS
jgi:amino acid adenylation domain-containing protein